MNSDVLNKIDFTGRVAVVTGGGRGMGRAYCLLLASRGAKVVVNDPGVQSTGIGGDGAVAEQVVAEIRALGGQAVASCDSVATPEGGAAIIATALEAFGTVDLLVNNAGIVNPSEFADQPIDEVMRTLNVHLVGAWHVGQPAWKVMEEQGFGRIVLTTSIAQFGQASDPAYSAAKAGLSGLTKALAHEARSKDLNIKVNAISPIAMSRNASATTRQVWGDLISPDNVAPVVAYLLSEGCSLNGEIVQAGGSHLARVFFGQSQGWVAKALPLSPEDVRDHLAEAFDLEGFGVPDDVASSMALVKARVFK